jgi:hypothetical protein
LEILIALINFFPFIKFECVNEGKMVNSFHARGDFTPNKSIAHKSICLAFTKVQIDFIVKLYAVTLRFAFIYDAEIDDGSLISSITEMSFLRGEQWTKMGGHSLHGYCLIGG